MHLYYDTIYSSSIIAQIGEIKIYNNFENDYGQLYIYIGNDNLFKKLCKEINYDTDCVPYIS